MVESPWQRRVQWSSLRLGRAVMTAIHFLASSAKRQDGLGVACVAAA